MTNLPRHRLDPWLEYRCYSRGGVSIPVRLLAVVGHAQADADASPTGLASLEHMKAFPEPIEAGSDMALCKTLD